MHKFKFNSTPFLQIEHQVIIATFNQLLCGSLKSPQIDESPEQNREAYFIINKLPICLRQIKG